MERRKGWVSEEWLWEELYDANMSFYFLHEGKEYFCCNDQHATESYVYALPEWKKIAIYDGKDAFYNGMLFGKQLKQVIDESEVTFIC